MPEPTETALDVVNAALGGEHADPLESAEVEDPSADGSDADADGTASEGGEDSPEGDAPTGDADGEGEDAAGEAEGESEGNLERNADGTFKKRAEGDKPGETPKQKDAVNDPIPKDLKADTRERMQALIKTAKDLTAERDAATQNFEVFINGLRSAGVTPDQYGETLSWLSLFNSGMNGNAGHGKQALDILEQAADRLATYLGVERASSDPLAAHPDLLQAVQQNQISKKYAMEVARGRNQQKFRGELTTQANTVQQQRAEAQRVEQEARSGLTNLENQLRAQDSRYDEKRAILVPQLKAVMRNVPYQNWVQTFKQAYDNLKLPPKAARQSVPTKQPLRGNKQPAGGGQRAPGSMLDAINGALAGLEK